MDFLPSALTHQIDGVVGAPAATGPARIVLDNTGFSTSTLAFRDYAATGVVPHFTLDPYSREVWQHISTDNSAFRVTNPPIEPHRMGKTIWVIILKLDNLSEGQTSWVGEQVAAIAAAVGAPLVREDFPTETSVEYKTSRLSLGLWKTFSGICGASHVPHTASSGPGYLDVEAFDSGLGSVTAASTLSPAILDVQVAIKDPEVDNGFERCDAPSPHGSAGCAKDKGHDGSHMNRGGLWSDALSEPEEEPEPVVALGKFGGRPVKQGSGGKAVDALRAAFGLPEGKFDNELHVLVVQAQETAELPADGVVDADTWEALDSLSESVPDGGE